MLVFDEIRLELEKYRSALEDLKVSIDPDTLKLKVDEYDMKVSEPGFWDDPEKSQKIMQEAGAVKNKLNGYNEVLQAYEDTEVLIEMANEEGDDAMAEEVREQLNTFVEKYEKLRITTLMTGEFDSHNAIVTLHPGAGGTEACDWTSMLYRMYTRWAEKHGYKVDVMDYQDGDEAGIKSVTIKVNGENAFGFLKAEKGIHRLVRISPFDSAGRRHTSFASCDVMPELDDSIHVEINPDDLRIDVFRSSGAGGQHINKTSSAIRITHLPTGIVVSCQNERSQFQNKDQAMMMLKAKLYDLEQEKKKEELSDIRGEVKENAFGSQIRSYVFCPYTLVKDLRTGEEKGNIQAVMDGDLDSFMNAYLAWLNNK